MNHEPSHPTGSAQALSALTMNHPGGPPKLEIEKISDGPITCLRVSGAITEKLDGKKLAAGLKAKHLVVDFSGVTNISSFGIREWIAFNRAIDRAVEKVYLIGCAPALMHEIQVVTDFVGKGLIFSFYAPYLCEQCDTSRQVLLNVDRDADAIREMTPPLLSCETCGSPEVFDEDPATFFAHVAHQRAFDIEPAVVGFLVAKLGYPATDLALRVQADKYIDDRYVYLRLIGDLSAQFSPERLGEGLQGTVVIDVAGANCASHNGVAQFHKLLSIAGLSADVVLIHGCQGMLLDGIPKDPKIQVATVLLPYKCSSCATSGTELLEVDKHHHLFALGMPPSVPCKACGQPTSYVSNSDAQKHLSSLPKPAIDAKLKKFIEHAQKRKPKVEKKEEKAEGAPVGSRAIAYGMIGAVVVAAGLIAVNYYQQRQSAELMQDTVEKLKQPAQLSRPTWISSDLPGTSYCTTHEQRQTTCVGVSAYVTSEQEGRTEAWNAALDAVVHAISLRIDDPAFGQQVRKRYADARQAMLSAVDPTDEATLKTAQQKVREAREHVAKSFARTGGVAAPTQMSDWYWEKYEKKSGPGHEFLVFVRVDVPQDAIDLLVHRYADPIDGAGAKVVTTFPGLAWKTPGEWDGVNVIDLKKGPLEDAGVKVGDVILAIGDQAVRDNEDFGELIAGIKPGALRVRVARGEGDVLNLP